MVKTPSSFVLASLRGSTYRTEYASPLRSLRPCLWQRRISVRRGGWVRREDVLTNLQSTYTYT
jgi:hypothetical protein